MITFRIKDFITNLLTTVIQTITAIPITIAILIILRSKRGGGGGGRRRCVAHLAEAK